MKLQNYTAVEKDEVILSCELSKAVTDVKWFKDGNEIFPSKNVLFQAEGKKRVLIIKKAAKSNMGTYTCDCGTDKTSADLNIEGNVCIKLVPLPDTDGLQNLTISKRFTDIFCVHLPFITLNVLIVSYNNLYPSYSALMCVYLDINIFFKSLVFCLCVVC